VDIASVLLGSGVRLFDHLSGTPAVIGKNAWRSPSRTSPFPDKRWQMKVSRLPRGGSVVLLSGSVVPLILEAGQLSLAPESL
jgi:hypothetical protein